jgi:lipoprotein NlpI
MTKWFMTSAMSKYGIAIGLMLLATPVFAKPYGATALITYKVNGQARAAFGINWGSDTQAEADKKAVASCSAQSGRSCQVSTRFSGGYCGYVTTGHNKTSAWVVTGPTAENVTERCLRGGANAICDPPVGGCTTEINSSSVNPPPPSSSALFAPTEYLFAHPPTVDPPSVSSPSVFSASNIPAGTARTWCEEDRFDDDRLIDQKIQGCTARIQSGSLMPRDLSKTYYSRGITYDAKGDNDRAIADFDQVIRLDPKDVDAYFNRGKAYHGKGDDDLAIADYNQAIRLEPKADRVFFARGLAYFAKGDNHNAIADYTKFLQLDPKSAEGYLTRGVVNLYAGYQPQALADLYQAIALDPKNAFAALWLDIVGQRRLSEAISTIDMTTWPAAMIRMFLGQMPLAAVLAAADDPNVTCSMVRKGRVCQAYFYGGKLALRQGEKDEAARLFRLAAGDCQRIFIVAAANAELRALDVAQSSSVAPPSSIAIAPATAPSSPSPYQGPQFLVPETLGGGKTGY